MCNWVLRYDLFFAVAMAVALLTFCSGPLEAQLTGTIGGYVKDPSGAAVPGVSVTARLTQQQTARTSQTNSEGFYNFVALPPGDYEMTFEVSGFQKEVRKGVALSINQNARVDASLEVGSVETQIMVTSTAPLVDTVSPTLSGLVDDRRIVDLPINGRNIMSLAGILPGVLGVSAPQQMTESRTGPSMSVNGGRVNMNAFTFNGGFFNNPSRNTGVNFPPPDATQEVRILTHNFAPEYGRNPGSQVTVISKSGTNELHGSVWEFLRNNHLNARNFFSPRVAALHQNQFGGAAGGPVRKDKLFVFGSYQGLRDHREAQSVTSFVPTTAQRNGDFSALGKALSNPTDPLTGKPLLDSITGAPCVAGNRISAGCMSPAAAKLLSFVPDAPGGSLVALSASPLRGDMFMGRADWNPSSKHRIFGSYFLDHNLRFNPLTGGGSIADFMSDTTSQYTHQVAVNDTYMFSPTLLNQATFSWLRSNSSVAQNKTVDPTQLGINMPQYIPTGAVVVNVGGNFVLGTGSNSRYYSTNFQIKEGLNWTRGRHQFKFGYEWLSLQFRQAWISTPTFSVTGDATGNAMADFMLGRFNNLSMNFGVRDNDTVTNAHSMFFQDEFKVHPRFTLTYGVRWEPFLPWVDRADRIDTVRPYQQSKVVPDAPPGVLFPGDVPRGIVNSDLNNFAPRLGFAWDVFGNGKTAVRGGYGLFYESINADSLAQENAPFAGKTIIYNGRLDNPFGSLGLANPPVTTTGAFGCTKIAAYPGYSCPLFPLPVSGLFIGPTLRSPYIQSFSLSVQRQVTSSLLIESAYAGKIGIKIEALRTYNPALFINSSRDGSAPSDQNANDRVMYEPGILAPTGWLLGNDFRSWYHSWQTQLTKRFSRGLTVMASYSLSKSIDGSSTPNLGSTVANPFNLRDERGRSDWDRRHAFVASWLWSPQWKSSSKALNGIVGGWTFTAITTAQSGGPLTFVMGSDVALDGTGGGGKQHAMLAPDMTRDNIVLDHPSRAAFISNFLNTSAFIQPRLVQRGIYGNAGRGLISGPAMGNTDFSVLKDFNLRERRKLQFRSEFFNVLNQVNFSNPNTTVSAGTFGRITAARDGRVIQFALKLVF
jgi:hypothetical protein